MAAIRTLSPAVLAVLEGALVEGGVLRLPPGQLDRKVYVEVDKALTAMGGRWDRRARGHVFAEGVDAAAELDAALQNGAVTDRKKQLGFFETPLVVAERVVRAADVQPGMRVLEPSAGRGGILAALPLGLDVVEAVEVDGRHASALTAALARFGPDTSTTHASADFLRFRGLESGYDAVVMNPPFAGQVDIDHVLHALGMLAPGGRLASVMSAGTAWRENRKARDFRALVDARGGRFVSLPEGSFTPSGTDVNTVLVTIPSDRSKPSLAKLLQGARA